MRIFRFIKIVYTVIRFGLDEVMLSRIDDRRVKLLLRITTIGRRYSDPPAVRLRHALESLGPIFVKFGQVLSTRRDLLSVDFANELAKLQDQVPPFDSAVAIGIIEKSLGAPVDELRMAMPVNVRDGATSGPGNAFVPTRILVPVIPKDPAERFTLVRARLAEVRKEPAIAAVAPLSGMMALLPPPVLLALARVQSATIDFATSNLRGSPVDLYTGGARIEANYPMGPREGAPLNVTMISYRGELQMGLHLDPAAITDPGALLESMHESFDSLLLAAL